MKILQIGAGDFFSTYGGGQVYVKNLVDEMASQIQDSQSSNGEIKVVVISFLNKSLNKRKRDYNGIELWEVTENISEEQLSNIIEEISPDVIHAHSHKALICRIGYDKKIPVVVTSHHGGLWCPSGSAMDCKDQICCRKVNHKDCLPCVLRNTRTGLKYWYPFMKYLSKEKYIKFGESLKTKPFIPFITPIWSSALYIQNKRNDWEEIVEKCSLMIAPSNKMAEVMIANGMPEEKIRVVPHGIPLPKEKPPFPEIQDGKIKFFYVGRICYVKGIHILLEAFSKIENPQIELHLIGGAGNKSETRYMERLQRKYYNDKRIKWHGKISPEEVFEKTKDFHIAVSPSIYLEAFGLNIAEALALGKPVLATKSGGGEMQVKDEFNGWLITQNNALALRNKMNDIIDRPEVLLNLSINCNSIPIKMHIKELLSFYEKL